MKDSGVYQALTRYFATPERGDVLRITVGMDAEIDALPAALQGIRLPSRGRGSV